MTRAYIICEGLRPDSSLADLKASLVKVERHTPSNAAPNQPKVWTTVTFESSIEPTRLAEKFSEVLTDRPSAWYTHFRAADEMFVIFPHRIFRYRVGDLSERTQVQDYARSVGVPPSQVDWDEA